MKGKAVRLVPDQRGQKTYEFYLILHNRGGGVLGTVDWEVPAKNLRDAENQADTILRAEISAQGGVWVTRSSVKEVK